MLWYVPEFIFYQDNDIWSRYFFEGSKSPTITTVNGHPQLVSLAEHSLDTLLAEIRQRGFKVTIESVS